MKKVILISGKARHGKDTAAAYLKEKLENNGNKVAIIHFAKYIKNLLKDYYEWDGITKDTYYRSLLQYLGTDRIRKELNKPMFHVNRVCEDIEIIKNDFDYFIIPDTRFFNEIDYVKAYFPKSVIDLRVERGGFDNGLSDEQRNHQSEVDLDDYPFLHRIHASDIEELYSKLDSIIKSEKLI